MAASEYKLQGRGGRGVSGVNTKDKNKKSMEYEGVEDDFVTNVMAVNSHSHLMMFTNYGKVQVQKAYRIAEVSRQAKGNKVHDLLQISEGEKITAMIAVQNFDEGQYLLMVTRNGVVKRTALSEFAYQRKGGKIALSLDEGDELVFVCKTDGSKHIIIATHEGNAARFDENDARVMGRTARGVRGIRLSETDYVVGVTMVEEGKQLLTITENGYGKRCSFDEFTAHNRGGKGVTVQKVTDKTGYLATVDSVSEKDDVLVITDGGVTIRVSAESISEYSRTATGVRIMKPDENSKVIKFTNIGNEDDEIEELPDEGEDIPDEGEADALTAVEEVTEAETEENNENEGESEE